MSLSRLLKSPFVYIVITSAIQILIAAVAMLSQSIGERLALGVLIVLGIINVGVIYKYTNRIKNKDDLIKELLELCIKGIWQDESGKYRGNVMMLDEKDQLLHVKYFHNMALNEDRFIKLRVGTGCAGQAFTLGKPVFADISKDGHSHYNLEPQLERLIWADMASIISFPLINTRSNRHETMGILNIDTSLKIAESGFLVDEVEAELRCFASLLSSVLSDEF